MTINTKEVGSVFPDFTLVKTVIEIVSRQAGGINAEFSYGQLLNRKDLPKKRFTNGILATQIMIAETVGELEPAVFSELDKLHGMYKLKREAFRTTRRYDVYEGCMLTRNEHVHHVLGHEATKPFVLL